VCVHENTWMRENGRKRKEIRTHVLFSARASGQIPACQIIQLGPLVIHKSKILCAHARARQASHAHAHNPHGKRLTRKFSGPSTGSWSSSQRGQWNRDQPCVVCGLFSMQPLPNVQEETRDVKERREMLTCLGKRNAGVDIPFLIFEFSFFTIFSSTFSPNWRFDLKSDVSTRCPISDRTTPVSCRRPI